MRFKDYNPDYPRSEPSYEPGYEQEPTIERGKDRFRFWWKVLIAVIIAGIIIGYIASVSYTVYPYTVTVGGTFTSSDGGEVQLLGMAECSAWIYTHCSDPGLTPVYDCLAPADMNITSYCMFFSFESNPGHYQISLRNGEDYTVVGYLVNSKGGFDKVCDERIILDPVVRAHNSTQNLSC